MEICKKHIIHGGSIAYDDGKYNEKDCPACEQVKELRKIIEELQWKVVELKNKEGKGAG